MPKMTTMQQQPTRIHLTTGDLFDVQRYGFQGVALFVPAGMTAFRVLASDFVKACGKPLSVSGPLEVFRVESDDVAPLARIVRAANPRQKSFAKEDIGLLVERAFSAFEDAECTIVGMNGFRLEGDDRSQNQFRSEQATLDAVRQWVATHPRTTIRDIYLVDKRGGFEHTT